MKSVFGMTVATLVMLVLFYPAAISATERSAQIQRPVTVDEAQQALAVAHRYASVQYEVVGEVQTGVAYQLGGQVSIDRYLERVAEGDRPGDDVGIDASGLVIAAYRTVIPELILLMRTGSGNTVRIRDASSSTLFTWNRLELPVDRLRPGDLLFFKSAAGKIGGVAIFDHATVDRVHFVVASANSGKVISTLLRRDGEYWRHRFAGAGRLLIVGY